MARDDVDLSHLPRAPSQAEWDRLTPAQRERVVDALPATFTEAELSPPEGDPHRLPIESVDYPDEQRFAPDLFVVLDVDPEPRMRWAVSHDGRGLDWVLEVLVKGDRHRDLVKNVERYARLGIPEYVVYDRARHQLRAWRLATPDARTYTPVLPQLGLIRSDVLDLELRVEDDRLRFFHANAPLPRTAELLARMNRAYAEVEARIEEAERAREAERRAREAAETRAAALEAELARLRGQPDGD